MTISLQNLNGCRSHGVKERKKKVGGQWIINEAFNIKEKNFHLPSFESPFWKHHILVNNNNYPIVDV